MLIDDFLFRLRRESNKVLGSGRSESESELSDLVMAESSVSSEGEKDLNS